MRKKEKNKKHRTRRQRVFFADAFFAAVPPGSSENAAPAFLSLRKSAAVDFLQTIDRASCRFQIDLLHGAALVIAVDAKKICPPRAGLNKAKDMLESESSSVTDIAYAPGYNDVYEFSRDFKKQVGLSPSRYKNGR